MNAYNLNLKNLIIKEFSLMWILIAMGLLGGIIAFPISFLAKTNVLLGCVLFPFALFYNGKKRLNYLFLLLSIGSVAVSILYNVRSFYFIAIAFYVLLVLESFIGRINGLVLFLIVFMSPFFEQISLVLGFPIRLFLSGAAGKMLQVMGMKIQVEGNLMTLNGTSFSVDDACMGLNMLSVSFIMGVFLISHHYRLLGRKLSIVSLGLFFLGVFCLNLLSNLLRIIFLVIFEIMPENPFHELIGVGCLLAYITVPMYFISKWFVKAFGNSLENSTVSYSRFGLGKVILLVFLAINVMWAGFQVKNTREKCILEHANVELWNLKPIQLKSGITKFSNKEILLYVKPIPEFISGEHSPLMCWKGSGYEFKSIRMVKIGTTEIFTGKLKKAGSALHTAWWYSNGKSNTISQLDWRFKMMQGEGRFCIVNISASDEEKLLSNIYKVLVKGELKID